LSQIRAAKPGSTRWEPLEAAQAGCSLARKLARTLAVFRGGCTIDAAEQVAGADLDRLQSLVDKSLLRHTGERFWMMLETIREFARERLVAGGEEVELRRAHALRAVAFAEATMQEMEEGGDQELGFACFDAEYDNLRAALEWARDSGADEILLRLTAALGLFWGRCGYNLFGHLECARARARALPGHGAHRSAAHRSDTRIGNP
jgi:predicted ATPase